MLAAVRSATLIGVDGQPVTVEVHVSSGLPAYQVVGLPDAAVRESHEQRAAPRCCRRVWSGPNGASPSTSHRVACARSGSGLELAVALGVPSAPTRRCRRACSTASPCWVSSASTARCAPVPGTLALVDALARDGCRARRRADGERVGSRPGGRRAGCGPRARSASCGACLKGEEPWPDWDPPAGTARCRRPRSDARRRGGRPRRRPRPAVRAAGARGRGGGWAPPPVLRSAGHRQDDARPTARHDPPAAVTCRGAGGHPHPLGRGRARRRHGWCADARSARRTTPRRPRHSSAAAAVGPVRARSRSRTAGRSSSTSSGEFAPTALDALRQPLEERAVRISRQAVSLTFPAAFQLVACSNPCPCGSGGNGLSLQRRATRAISTAAERTAARPVRPARACRRARVRRRARRVVGRRGGARRGRPSNANAPGTPTGRGRRTRTSPRVRCRGSCRSAADADEVWRELIGDRGAHRTAAPPGSAAWRVRSPTSTTAPASRRPPRDRAAWMRGDVP